jgi:hypothetical protein
MDFTAYYAAGKTMNANLNPYKNYILEDWDLWDGLATYKHSRFLYPPLVAVFFQPFAVMKYSDAKFLWNVINLLLYLFIVLILLFIFEFQKDLFKILLVFTLALNFFPFIALLERGQIDLLTFLPVILGFLAYKKEKDFFAGLLWSVAIIFKLYTLLFIPFLLLIKKYRTLKGFLSGTVLLFLLMIIVNGKNLTWNYFFKELPRISAYGNAGTDEMKIKNQTLQEYFPMTPVSITVVDGKPYITESISFNSKASFIRILQVVQEKLKVNFPNSYYSFLIFILLFLLVYLFYRKNKITDFYKFAIFWQTAFAVVLLTSPFTWVMNLVWLLPVIFIGIYTLPVLFRNKKYFLIILLIAGYIMLSVPDNLLLTKNSSLTEFFKSRFVISEIIILISLFFVFKNSNCIQSTEKIFTENKT